MAADVTIDGLAWVAGVTNEAADGDGESTGAKDGSGVTDVVDCGVDCGVEGADGGRGTNGVAPVRFAAVSPNGAPCGNRA